VIGYGREAVLCHGTYAELFAAEVEMLACKPKQSTWEQAAGLPLAGLTAYQAVTRVLRVQDGETLLVHGAAGGAGSLSAQIAIAAGARVIGTASPRNHPYLRSIGVEPVTYGAGLVDGIRSLVHPRGTDAVLDTSGQGVLEFRAQFGDRTARASTVVGVADGVTPVFARNSPADLAAVVRLVEAGHLAVRVAEIFPLGAAAGTAAPPNPATRGTWAQGTSRLSWYPDRPILPLAPAPPQGLADSTAPAAFSTVLRCALRGPQEEPLLGAPGLTRASMPPPGMASSSHGPR
jgi:hypothetical protein